MNTKQLDLVLDLSRTLSYRKTAANMFISQPALTHQIKSLEAELGVQLFQRSTQGVQLTPAGELFCKEMTHILQRTREAVATVRNCSASGYSQTLRAGISATRTFEANRETIRRFLGDYPDVMLELYQERSGENRLNAFLRNEIDVVFYVSESIPENPGISKLKLFDSEIYCVVPSEHRLASKQLIRPEDLAHECIMLHHEQKPWSILSPLQHAQELLISHVPVTSRLCCNAETALLLISAVQGAALMPGFCYRSDSRFAWIKYDYDGTIPMSLAWHSADQRDFVSGFIGIAQAVFEEQRRIGGIL